jgi:RNA polymerase subunit RPABC4/transcription elongation factor Spt4
MVGYKHPCNYCDKLVPKDAKICPYCGKSDPTGPLRCPICRSPIEPGWLLCSHCGQKLQIRCPQCGKDTLVGDKCVQCSASLMVVCPNKKCKHPQPPGEVCIMCGKQLK